MRTRSANPISCYLAYTFLFIISSCFSGCVYREPPPDKIELVRILHEAETSMRVFSFDLDSALMIPYITDFGKKPLSSNQVSYGNDVVFTIPFCPLRPRWFVIELRGEPTTSTRGFIRVYLNGKDIGFMGVPRGTSRKKFTFDPSDWIPEINIIKISAPDPETSVSVDNLWLIADSGVRTDALQDGNSFCGFAVFPENLAWESGIFLAPGASLTFPLHLPEKQSFFTCFTYSDQNADVLLNIELTTAKILSFEAPLKTQVAFKKPDQWLPVKWDISERAGRYAALKVTNNGATRVILKDAVITKF